MLKIAVALAVVASTTANAAVSTWNGTASISWTNAASWSLGVPAEGDDVVIADTTVNNSLTVNDASHTIGTLTYGTTGTRATAFAINDNVTGSAGATWTPVPGSTLTNVVYVPFGATNTFFRLNNKQ
jgi:hypothetical protein